MCSSDFKSPSQAKSANVGLGKPFSLQHGHCYEFNNDCYMRRKQQGYTV